MTVLPPELNFARRRRLPVVQASEGAECGLACLAMIARYHGHSVDLNGMRQLFPVSMAGATLAALLGMARALQFSGRAVRAELEELPDLKTPAILHWDLNHFVVLKRVKDGRVCIHDPARGARSYDLEEVSRHFTGVALELTPVGDFQAIRAERSLRLTDLWSRMVGFWPAVAQIVGLSLALQVAVFALPFQLQLVIDEAIMRGDAPLLTVLALGFGAVIVVQAALEGLRNWTIQVFGQLLGFQMVANLLAHLIRLPSDFFEKRHVGDILSRLGSASAIQDTLSRGMIAALIDGVMALATCAILFVYAPLLAWIVILTVGLNAVIAAIIFPMMRRRTEEQLIERAREQSHIMETVRAASVIKIMGGEAERENAWRNLYANVINASVSVGKFSLSLSASQTLVTGLQTVVVIYFGARAIMGGEGLSVGMLIAFLSFRQTFSDRALSLINQAIQFKFLGLHLERLADIATAKADAIEPAPHMVVKGGVRLRGVDFAYGGFDRQVLSGIDLTIAPGEFVGITGPSGGGKTTLLKLMLGLQEPTKGQIELDGNAASPRTWRAWRRHVGVVSQDDRLLSGTIAENIAFFDPNLDMVRVTEAAVAARIHDDITIMPMQYLSLVGDMGSSLSGGQKQRVLLARALYRKPQILFLDEGTANLDIETEERIADLLKSLPITRIVVAHRPALLRCVDRVIRIEGGVAVREAEGAEAA